MSTHEPNVQLLADSNYVELRAETGIAADIRIQCQGPDPVRVVFGGSQPAKGQQTHGYRLNDREYIDVDTEAVIWVGADLDYQRSTVCITEIS